MGLTISISCGGIGIDMRQSLESFLEILNLDWLEDEHGVETIK